MVVVTGMMMTRIFGPNEEKVTGCWKKNYLMSSFIVFTHQLILPARINQEG